IVLDDDQAERKGFDATSSAIGPYVGKGYRHDGGTDRGKQRATYTPDLPEKGPYEVRVSYSPSSNRATNVPITITDAEGKTTLTINQRKAPALDRAWVSLGVFSFDKGKGGSVTITNTGVDGHVIIDAVQWVRVKE